jgi:polar amino acid transport system permease protein
MAGISQFDPELFVKILPNLAYGAFVTLKLTSISTLLGLIFGTVLGLGRISKNPLLFGFSTAHMLSLSGVLLCSYR